MTDSPSISRRVFIVEREKSALIAQTQVAESFASGSLHWEIGNAFSAVLKRERITLEQAKAAIEVYEQISRLPRSVSLPGCCSNSGDERC